MDTKDFRTLPNDKYFSLFFERYNVKQAIALYNMGYRNILILYPDKTEAYVNDDMTADDFIRLSEQDCLFGADKDDVITYKFIFEKLKGSKVVDRFTVFTTGFSVESAISNINNENIVDDEAETIFDYLKSKGFSEYAIYNTSALKMVQMGTF